VVDHFEPVARQQQVSVTSRLAPSASVDIFICDRAGWLLPCCFTSQCKAAKLHGRL